MSAPGPEVFARARRELVPARGLASVHLRAERIRRRRRAVAVGATGSAVAGLIAVVAGVTWLFTPGTGPQELPRGTSSTAAGSSRTGGSGVPGASSSGLTAPPAAGRTADGLLDPADLGPGGWIRGTETGDTRQPTGATQVACARPGAAEYTGPGSGRGQLFRGSTPQGAEWLLDEQVVHLDATAAARIRTLLHGTAGGCPTVIGGDTVLAANDGLLVTGTLQPDGSVGYAHAYALAGSTWISLETLPGGAAGGIPLPGQAQWLLDVAAKALERATGTRPPVPAPNAAARRAAAHYVTPTAVMHVESPTPTSAASPAGASGSAVPAGFLAVPDLGATGGWSVDPAHDRQTSAATVVDLPTCSSVEQKVIGGGGSLMYRGSTSGGSGEWILNETVVRLDATAGAAARTALAAAAACPAVRSTFGAGTRGRHDPTTLVLGFPLADGSTGFAQGWALRGDVLVQLDTLPGGAVGGARLPGGVAWLEGVLATAASRAG